MPPTWEQPARNFRTTHFPNAFAGASPGFAPHTEFDNAGNVTGGFGVENIITANSHSTYNALQTSLSGTVGHGGPGIQASYTWGKSIDDTSFVLARNRLDRRGCCGNCAESFRRSSGKGAFVLRRHAWLWVERCAGSAS